jgi:hypothetical protein
VLGSTYDYNPDTTSTYDYNHDTTFDEVLRVYSSKKVAEQFIEKYKESWDELQILQYEVQKTFGG